MFGGRVGVDHGFDERIGSQAVAAVESGAGAFAHGVEPLDGRAGIQVHLDAAAEVVGAGCHGDVLPRDVDADAQAFLVDIGEMSLCFLGVFVRHIEADVVDAVDFHLLVDGACHDVARGERESLVVFLHELLAVRQAEDAAVAAHGFRDEIGRVRFAGVEEGGGVELDKFHVLHRSLGAVGHGDAVAGGDVGVGRRTVHRPAAACAEHRDAREKGVDFPCVGVEDVGAVAFDVRGAPRHLHAEVVLRNDFHGKMILEHGDLRVRLDGLNQAALDFEARVVGMV